MSSPRFIPETITNKRQMYDALKAGRFGNTIRQFFSVEEWEKSEEYRRYAFWGVRSSVTSAHRMTRLYVPRDEVASYAGTHFADGANISQMIDTETVVTAWLEVWESETGICVQGIRYPERGRSWRDGMKTPKLWEGVLARQVLLKHLNPNSYADIEALLEHFPKHVVELSACEDCVGLIKGRNAVVWEVRNY